MAFLKWFEQKSNEGKVIFVRWVIWIAVLSLIGIVYSFYEDYRDKRILRELDSEISNLEDKVRHYEIERILMEAEIRALKDSQIKFNYLEEQYAEPRIIKSLNGDAYSINNAFYDTYMKPYGFEKKDYKNDEHYWGKEIAGYFKSVEAASVKLKRPITIDVKFKNPFVKDKNSYIEGEVTVNALKDRYGNHIGFEISIDKDYR